MSVSQDFVFGTLATSDLRVERLRGQASGAWHAHDLEPPDPRPGEPIVVRVTLGPDVDADRVTCYATFDGAEPDGDRGRATTGSSIELTRTDVRWDTLAWSYVESWSGTIPGQAAGTTIRYRLQAWSDDGRVSRWALDAADDTGRERAAPGETARGATFGVHVDDEAVPDWLRDAVIYQAFVDRFAGPTARPCRRPPTHRGSAAGRCAASGLASTTSRRSGRRACGCRRSSRARRTTATTRPTTCPSSRASGRSTISGTSSSPRMPAASA